MDKKLNEVTKVTDMAYVPVIMADGSIGQIAKADLASVVAGHMTSMKIDSDANNLVINGFYYMIGGENIPEPYFYIVVLRAVASPDFVQYGFGISSSTMYLRTFSNNEWSSWTRIG